MKRAKPGAKEVSEAGSKLKRKKTILDFNHIDPSLPKDEVEEIKKLYATYKRLWWGVSKKFTKSKNAFIWLKR